ncbi:hypothetical protein ACLKA7_005253 [Drosophila subpalustris]
MCLDSNPWPLITTEDDAQCIAPQALFASDYLDIDFIVTGLFYINEQLTKCNYNIFKEAMKMKKRKVLSAVFTRRALVYVRQKVNDDFVCLKSMEDLLALDLDSAAATETADLSAGVSQAGHSNFR